MGLLTMWNIIRNIFGFSLVSSNVVSSVNKISSADLLTIYIFTKPYVQGVVHCAIENVSLIICSLDFGIKGPSDFCEPIDFASVYFTMRVNLLPKCMNINYRLKMKSIIVLSGVLFLYK